MLRLLVPRSFEATTIGWHYLSNATCLIRPRSFYVSVCRVKEHRNVLHCSPLLKNTCVRQVVLDKWFPLKEANSSCHVAEADYTQTASPLCHL